MGAVDPRGLFDGISIFATLEPRERDELYRLTTTRRLAARDVLCRKGEPGSTLYAVTKGRLKVVSTGGDGKELVFNVMSPGDVIGEISLMDSNPRSATCVALEPCELLTLHRRDLIPFFERHPKTAIQVGVVLAALVRRLSERGEDASFLPLPNRMAKTVAALARSYDGGDGAPPEIRLSQQDLADMIGATRESVNKWLRSWEEEGLVELARARVRVLDVEKLAEIGTYTGL